MEYSIVKIDQFLLQDHHYLEEDDNCYFLGEYTPRAGALHSKTNQLILNLKKSMDRKDKPEWRHKQSAIKSCSAMLIACGIKFRNTTIVPIPPSKAKDDPLYDDRLIQIFNVIKAQQKIDFRELIIQKSSIQPFHVGNMKRPTPESLTQNYEIDQNLVTPVPSNIIIFDDVLTTGSHFKAAKQLLQSEFPNCNILGLFIARRKVDYFDE